MREGRATGVQKSGGSSSGHKNGGGGGGGGKNSGGSSSMPDASNGEPDREGDERAM